MHELSWFDDRTLVACDSMLAIAFAIVFFGMRRASANLRGINSIAISFILFVPGMLLIVATRNSSPGSPSIALANCCLFTSFVFLYRGILRFIGSRRTSFLPVALSLLAIAVLFHFSRNQDSVWARVVVISLTAGFIRGFIAFELFRKSAASPSPAVMRLFAAFMALFAATRIITGIAAAIRTGAPITTLQADSLSSSSLLLGMVSVFLTGLFILLLSSGQLIAASRDESQKDSLSGAFNRRGIEVKLAAELKRIQNGKHKLSIALIDVDYFKSINDIQGHAAGDAALRDVADAISTHLRGRDYLGRYGGDEFLIILPHTPCTIAVAVTDRLCNAVSALVASPGSIPLTLSIGLTEAVPEDDAVTLIARADKALYQAKSDGRNCRRVVIANNGAADPAPNTFSDSPHLADLLIPTAESPAIN
jgi:diguanylate cyclase (GGDEF)-like protein